MRIAPNFVADNWTGTHARFATQSTSREARPCDDILSLIGLDVSLIRLEVETRRRMNSVIRTLNIINRGSSWDRGDNFYDYFQDEYWRDGAQSLGWVEAGRNKTPKWLEALPQRYSCENIHPELINVYDWATCGGSAWFNKPSWITNRSIAKNWDSDSDSDSDSETITFGGDSDDARCWTDSDSDSDDY